MTTAATLGEQVGVVRACHSLGVARAAFYRQRARDAAPATVPAVARPAPPLKLTPAERDHALRSCMPSVSSMPHPTPCTPACSTQASIPARCAPATAS